MADGTQTVQTDANMAPPAQTPAAPPPVGMPQPTDGQQQPPAGDQQPPAEPYEGFNEAVAEFGNTSADTFLNEFLGSQGVDLQNLAPDGQQQGVPTTQGQPPVQPPGNGVPTPPNGTSAPAPQPGQAPQIDPQLLARLMAGPTAAPPPQMWPQAPQAQAPQWNRPVAPTSQPQPQPGQQQQDPNAPLTLFNEPFQLPQQLAEGLNHDDPNVRNAALGALVAAAGNTIVQRYHKYMMDNVMPQVSNQTIGQVQRMSFEGQVHRDLFSPFPHLRYASPALIQNAANIVVQDELARNPAAANGPIPPHVWQKIGQLASEGLRQMAGGQLPQMQLPPQAPQPPVAYGGWDAQGRPVQPQQPAYYPPPQQQAAPWMSGMNGQPFGMPPSMAPTPESEYAAFMQGAWGN